MCVHLFVLRYTLANLVQGVYANTTITLGVALDSGFFKVWGCVYAAMTLCMWLYVAWRSIGLVHTLALTVTEGGRARRRMSAATDVSVERRRQRRLVVQAGSGSGSSSSSAPASATPAPATTTATATTVDADGSTGGDAGTGAVE